MAVSVFPEGINTLMLTISRLTIQSSLRQIKTFTASGVLLSRIYFHHDTCMNFEWL